MENKSSEAVDVERKENGKNNCKREKEWMC